MNNKRKTLVLIILIAVVVASVMAVVVHQIATRPEPITRETFEEMLSDGLFDRVYLKNNKVTCVDLEGNRYSFTVEDSHEFDEYTRDVIDHMELETSYYSNVDHANQEES